MEHITVLKQEAVTLLDLKPDSVVVDATYGAGGHAAAICEKLDQRGVYIGIDADETALQNSFLHGQKGGPQFHLLHSNFSQLTELLGSLHIKRVDAILADLGWRTDQFTKGGKGFSFTSDEPLHMTYGAAEKYLFTAHDIVNGWAEEDIANVIYGYGEERYARKIARAIVLQRAEAPLMTARHLAEIVSSVVPKGRHAHRTHPATKTFQALRIAVNDELGVLEKFLSEAPTVLAPGGVLAIISFHSLEDRQVKLAFRELARTEHFALLTKKPITASDQELRDNPRARSAKLRAIKRLRDLEI